MLCSVEKFSWRAALQLTLPKEHGSWSLALEPVAFGLLVAPSAAGAALAVAALAGFFLRRPLKIILAGKNDSRQPLALVVVTILTCISFTSLLLAVRFGAAGGWWPLVPAAIAGAVFAWCDCQNEARAGAAEIAGVVAFGMLPAAFGALAGWRVAAALVLTLVMLVRSVPTVLTVRTALRIRKGQNFSIAPALVAAGAGIILTGWLGSLRLAPWLALVFAVMFSLRTMWLLLRRPKLSARTIGITEAVLGALMVLALALMW